MTHILKVIYKPNQALSKMIRTFNLTKKKTIKFHSWIKRGIFLIVTAFLANHLMEIDSFPLSKSYKFPLFSIFISIIIGFIILLITELNFKFFENKFFKKQINTKTLISFLLSTFGYITLLYIPSFYFVVWLKKGDFGIYYLVVGLSVTLLISTLAIVVLYTRKLYDLYKIETLTSKLIIPQGHNKIIVKISELAYFHSENKIVYAVLLNGQKISSDFTLNEVENKVNKQLFLRANRQTLIHSSSIREIKPIENGKLLVTLKPNISDKQDLQIVVSRYKKKEFNEWFKNKQEISTDHSGINS